LTFYILSMTIIPLLPIFSEVIGIVAFVLLILFGIISFRNKQMNYGADKVTSISLIARNKDRAILLMSLFVLFTAYVVLSKIEVLPKMYSDEFPQAYFELVNKAEMGDVESIEGIAKHEKFKEEFEKFLTNSQKRTIQ
jgi:hypothetical protein